MSHDPHQHASTHFAFTHLDVSSLLDQPGASRPVGLAVPVPEGFTVPLTTLLGDVTLDGVLESLVNGILLRSTVDVRATQQCASCLDSIGPLTLTTDVAELYEDPGDNGDVEAGYAILDTMIDVDAVVRDALAQVIPPAPKCRPDCAGLCPGCGINRNHQPCGCAEDDIDDRWSALSELKINPS